MSVGKAAVSAVLNGYVMNTLVQVPGTDQPLPSTGKWSVREARPETCPRDETPCVRVLYTVADDQVVCEWTVVPQQGSAPATFLDQNEDASHYLLRRLPTDQLAPLVVKASEPMYPPIAKAAHVNGVVTVQIAVSKEGRVSSVIAVRGPEMLRASTLDAAKKWSFRPLRVGTQQTGFVVQVNADYEMNDKGAFGSRSGPTVNMHP